LARERIAASNGTSPTGWGTGAGGVFVNEAIAVIVNAITHRIAIGGGEGCAARYGGPVGAGFRTRIFAGTYTAGYGSRPKVFVKLVITVIVNTVAGGVIGSRSPCCAIGSDDSALA
jgi:hypothetical protein